jgi:DNA-binding GntR family transcriptional regulator
VSHCVYLCLFSGAAVTKSSLVIPLDRASPVPLYFQVAQHLERAIAAGELAPGTRLENEILLADQLGLSRPTMRRAIQYLVDRGLLVRKRGVGTQVVQSKVRRPVVLTSLYDDLDKSGQQPRTEVLSFDIEPAADVAAHALGLADGSEVYHLQRLRYARDEPLALLRNYLPAGRIQLDREALERQGLYQILRGAGIRLKFADQTIGARAATASEGRLLGERKGAPLLTMTRTAYDDSGHALEYGTHVYRASVYSFELTLMTS